MKVQTTIRFGASNNEVTQSYNGKVVIVPITRENKTQLARDICLVHGIRSPSDRPRISRV